MAGGIDWFRWHHGSVTDPKFQLVARQAGASLPDVLAVWAYLLESASAAQERGNIGEIDCEAVDCMFNFPNTETRTADILTAMSKRGLLEGERITAWDKRQPKREREDDTAAGRQRAKRARDAADAADQSRPNDANPAHVTPCHATSHQKTPRGEESREENSSSPSGKKRSPRADAPLPVPVSVLIEAGLDEQTATEFIAHKAGLKAPLTARAWSDHLSEASKAGWTPMQAAAKVMAKGWKGFEAKYVASEVVPTGPAPPMSFRERDAELAKEVGRRWMGSCAPNSTDKDVIDMEEINARISMG